MRRTFLVSFGPFALAASLFFASSPGASAQDVSMKVCGDKWQAAKAANATQGMTWTKFLAECRTSAAAQPAAPAAAATPAPAAAATPTAAAKADAKPKTEAIFPASVPAKFSDLRPSKARQKACSEQYQANKAHNANGGMRWLEKGGGYWSACNRKLKGA